MDWKNYIPSSAVDVAYIVAVVLFILGIKNLGKPKTARRGNTLSALGMLIGIVVTLLDKQVLEYDIILIGLLASAAVGIFMARRVAMTSMPQMVALLNGFGGIASFLIAVSEYTNSGANLINRGGIDFVTLVLSALIGMLTFSGSIVAAMKLQEWISGKPIVYPLQKTLNALMLAGVAVLSVMLYISLSNASFYLDSLEAANMYFYIIGGLAFILGITLVIPIGGADMPVVVSLLNSYSGIAVAMTGFVLHNNALIIVGSLVGASGIILTNIMCKAMNRSILNVLFGGFGATAAGGDQREIAGNVKSATPDEAAMILDVAEKVIIVPGYGMAVSQAQHVVKKLTDYLSKKGTDVRFAVHPVAGRMPGHMNVLLAEAGVEYDRLFDMEINDDFATTDVTIVIGANDVVNPAAKDNPSSPIYGMPVLNVEASRTVLVLKRSMNPGFAGIENELFYKDNTLMVFGDAKKTIEGFITSLQEME